jgi:hypothetical protein
VNWLQDIGDKLLLLRSQLITHALPGFIDFTKNILTDQVAGSNDTGTDSQIRPVPLEPSAGCTDHIQGKLAITLSLKLKIVCCDALHSSWSMAMRHLIQAQVDDVVDVSSQLEGHPCMKLHIESVDHSKQTIEYHKPRH